MPEQIALAGELTILGGICSWIMDDVYLASVFTGKIRSDALPDGTRWPWILVGHVSDSRTRVSDMSIRNEAQVFVRLWALGYDACARLAKLIDNRLLAAKDEIRFSNSGVCTLFPSGGNLHPMMDESVSPGGGFVFRSDLRYSATIG